MVEYSRKNCYKGKFMEYKEPKGHKEYKKIKKLYKKAFPKNERKPFSVIKKMSKKGKSDILYFVDGEGFAGFATTINGKSEILVDYLAIAEDKRGQGKGKKAVGLILEKYKHLGVFLEIERPIEDAENYAERIRRKKFYLSSGFIPMNTYAKLFGVDMELLGVDCTLNYEEYKGFYLENYGKFAYDNITKSE